MKRKVVLAKDLVFENKYYDTDKPTAIELRYMGIYGNLQKFLPIYTTKNYNVDWDGCISFEYYPTAKWYADNIENEQSNNKNMEKRPVMLTLAEARKLYKHDQWKSVMLNSYTKEELEAPELPTSWRDIGLMDGYFITKDSAICLATECNSKLTQHKNVFATEKQAQSALAMAQLSQLMKAYNGDWTPNWTSNSDQIKYAITLHNGTVGKDDLYKSYQFLVFPTAKLRHTFLINFEPLINQYFEM